MSISAEDSRQIMQAKTDEELYLLLRVHSQDYTLRELAVANEEFRRRHLDVQSMSRITESAEKALEETTDGKPGGAASGKSVQSTSSIGRGLTTLGEGLSVVWKIAKFCGYALVFIFLAYGLYSWMDESGWISHREETVISARSDWLAGESKECLSYTRKREWATFQDKDVGYAMPWVKCDDGPDHQMKVTFYGRKLQPEYETISWRSEERRVGKECRSRWSPYH